jgi:hypothetical protein
MASIQKRIDKHGQVSYRVHVRLNGHPRMTATFKLKKDALAWGRKTEVEMQNRDLCITAFEQGF